MLLKYMDTKMGQLVELKSLPFWTNNFHSNLPQTPLIVLNLLYPPAVIIYIIACPLYLTILPQYKLCHNDYK